MFGVSAIDAVRVARVTRSRVGSARARTRRDGARRPAAAMTFRGRHPSTEAREPRRSRARVAPSRAVPGRRLSRARSAPRGPRVPHRFGRRPRSRAHG